MRYNEVMGPRQSLPDLWLLSDARNDELLPRAIRALPPKARGSTELHWPHSGGGATPMMPKKGLSSISVPHGMVQTPRFESIGMWVRR